MKIDVLDELERAIIQRKKVAADRINENGMSYLDGVNDGAYDAFVSVISDIRDLRKLTQQPKGAE